MGKENSIFNLKWFIFLVSLVILIWIIWFFFFSYAECNDWECFNNYLGGCDRATFIGESEMIFEYRIDGDEDGICKVNVRLLQGQLNNQDSLRLENKEMMCSLPEGIVMIPESNIGNCHGELKEGLQDLIIKGLHANIVQNLGRINLEVLDVPEINSTGA